MLALDKSELSPRDLAFAVQGLFRSEGDGLALLLSDNGPIQIVGELAEYTCRPIFPEHRQNKRLVEIGHGHVAQARNLILSPFATSDTPNLSPRTAGQAWNGPNHIGFNQGRK